jgi:hypothetical protein
VNSETAYFSDGMSRYAPWHLVTWLELSRAVLDKSVIQLVGYLCLRIAQDAYFQLFNQVSVSYHVLFQLIIVLFFSTPQQHSQ